MPHPRLNALSIVCDDLPATLAFYRLCGLESPEADSPHVEIDLGGFRVMFDAISTIQSFDPGWTRPDSGDSAMALAFECASAAQVDETVATLRAAGHTVAREPFDAFWGSATPRCATRTATTWTSTRRSERRHRGRAGRPTVRVQ